MLYGSMVYYGIAGEYYCPVPFKEVMELPKLVRKYLNRNNGTDFWVRLHSNGPGIYHYPMFDFDYHVDVWDVARREGLEGHIYRTEHGYHFFADTLMTLNECILHGVCMGVDEAYLRISKERGFFAIRCGRKQDRDYDDIVYIGHTSGETRKSKLLLAHDGICDRLSLLYEMTNRCRRQNPFFDLPKDEEPKEDAPF